MSWPLADIAAYMLSHASQSIIVLIYTADKTHLPCIANVSKQVLKNIG